MPGDPLELAARQLPGPAVRAILRWGGGPQVRTSTVEAIAIYMVQYRRKWQTSSSPDKSVQLNRATCHPTMHVGGHCSWLRLAAPGMATYDNAIDLVYEREESIGQGDV